MKMQFISFCFVVLALMSCGQTNKLSEKDYSWMPYNGDETLVFKSNTGKTDTIFLLKKDTLLAYPEAQSLNGIKCEEAVIFCKHSDPDASKNEHSYLKNYFFKIGMSKDRTAVMNIMLSAEDAKFYRLSPIKIDSLAKIDPVALNTPYAEYNDVYVLEGEDYSGNFSQRSNFVTKLYWSKSGGVVRYDKKDGIYWELLKK